MGKMLYGKLAGLNIKKHKRTYIPYIITCTIIIAMFYVLCSLSFNSGLSNVLGNDSVEKIIEFSLYFFGAFSFILLLYTNSFLMKNRKKEFGLYNILGLEKKHIFKIVFWENVYIFLITILSGLLLGMLFDKLFFLILTNLIEAKIELSFSISLDSIFLTAALFLAIFLLIFLISCIQVKRAKPIDLLKSGSVGEKEPKAKWVMATIGLICLVVGYYLAVTTTRKLGTMWIFFLAAALVIIATYFLFTAGSIALLKLLRKNKKFYYKTGHFVSISSMMYRMKKNAFGLATICLLSTSMLLINSSLLTIWVETENLLNQNTPRDFVFDSHVVRNYEETEAFPTVSESYGIEHIESKLKNSIDKVSQEKNWETKNFIQGFGFELVNAKTEEYQSIITLDTYNNVNCENKTLEDGEVLIFTPSYMIQASQNPKTISCFGENFKVKEKLDHINLISKLFSRFDSTSPYLVVKDFSIIEKLENSSEDIRFTSKNFVCGVDVPGNNKTDEFSEAVRKDFFEKNDTDKNNEYSIESAVRYTHRQDVLQVFGSLLFIGMFLGLFFLIATILMIYYKQISEAYDDRKRFEIMQKVGINKNEIKSSVRSQILTMFFLPLITSGIHIAFCIPFLLQVFKLFQMNDTGFILSCLGICFLGFSLIYSLIYMITAKIYYKIVS